MSYLTKAMRDTLCQRPNMQTPKTQLDHFDFGRFGSVDFITWLHEHTKNYGLGNPGEFVNHIPPGSFAVDIGAYTGDTTIPMALCVGPTGKVVGFEPGPVSFELFKQNAALSKLPVDAYNYAITDTGGDCVFHYVDDRYVNGGYSAKIACGPEKCHNHIEHTVKSVKLTEFLREHYAEWLPKWSFLKIDTEGYDKDILHANVELLREFKPVIQVEVYPFLDFDERQSLIDGIRAVGCRYTCPEHFFFHEFPSVYNVICVPN